VVAGSWIELDVTALVDGPGTYAFALSSTSTDSAYYSSREGPEPPQLVVTSLVLPPDTTAPTVADRSPAPGATLVPRATTVTVVFDEPVQGVDGASFVLRRGSTPVTASVTYNAATRTAVLDPATDLLAGTTYTVSLTAAITDLAPEANALSPVSWSFTTVPASPGTQTFPALADAQVKSTSPGTNYGADAELRARAPSPEYRTFVRFQVSGLEGDVSAAHLRVFATRDTTGGSQLFPANNGWSESSITWSNAPPPLTGPLATSGAASNGTWVDYDVTAHVMGEGTYSFVLLSSSTDSFFLSSREGAHAPELVVTIEVPPPDTTPPALVSRDPAPNAGAVPVDAPVTVVFDEPVQGVSAGTFLLQRGVQPVAASVHYDAGTRTAVLDPVFDLRDGVAYTVALTAGIMDLAPEPNALVPESWSFTTVSTGATTLVATADADAQVKSSAPDANFGADPTLRVRAPTPEYRTYVRFLVDGAQGTVASATLRLYATDATDDCGSVYLVTQAWSESAITWNAAPGVVGGPLAAPGATTAERWVEFDVTGAVSGDGIHSFALISSSVDSAIYASREGGHPPELVLELAGSASGGPRTLPAAEPVGPVRELR